MPQFSYHTPIASSTLRNMINSEKLVNYKRPIGVIADSINYSYGFDGETYWVALGILKHSLTNAKMSFEESKAVHDALVFNESNIHLIDCGKSFTNLLKQARKECNSYDSLFWFFVNKI